jgi:hypothetical protein
MVVLIVGGLFVAASILSLLLAWYPLRSFNGPFLASFSRLWLTKAMMTGQAFDVHMKAKAKYGDSLIRVAHDLLITSDPDTVRHINGARQGYTKDEWYNPFRMDPYNHSMLSTTDGKYHDYVKAATAAGYSGRDVPTLESDVDSQIISLKELLRRNYVSPPGKPAKIVDISKPLQYFTLDTITKIAYGQEFGFLATDSDVHGVIKTTDMTLPLINVCMEIPLVGRLLYSRPILRLIGPKDTDSFGLGRIMGQAAPRQVHF